jgi:hypothetical protein
VLGGILLLCRFRENPFLITKLFRDPDGENSFLEIKYISLNEGITIKKNFDMILVHQYYRINYSRNSFV